MKPEYEHYLAELIQNDRTRHNDNRTDEQVLRAKCMDYTAKFVKKFPHLKRVPGFYGGYLEEDIGFNTEHWWCVDIDGTIVDPTVKQFLTWTGPYIPFDDLLHQVKIGRCMICGDDIYGRMSDGHSDCCSEACADYF